MTPMPLLATSALSVTIGGKTVCRSLSWSGQAGEVWAVLGENGAGKSTLLATLAGSRPAAGGTVEAAGRPLAALHARERARRIGWLVQHDEDPFPSTVLEQVLVGRHPHLGRFDWESGDDESIARAALQAVDLAGFEDRDTTTLSGGERRRVALAALLAQESPVLLLDEPLAQLDLRHQVLVASLLRHLAQEGRLVILVTHDPNLAARFATHALLLFGEGHCEAGPTAEMLQADRLARLYRSPVRTIEVDGVPVFWSDLAAGAWPPHA